MATKCVAAALQHGHRRRLKKRSGSKISKQQPVRLAALKRARLQQQKNKDSASDASETSSCDASSSSSRESSPVYQTRPQILTPENRQMLEELFGRYNDEERHAADVLSSLCKAGLVRKVESAAAIKSESSDAKADVLALPTMRQTTHMLSSWQSVVAGSPPPSIKVDADADTDDCDSDVPMTPGLSFSASSSARSSVSGGSPSPISDDSLGSPVLQYARLSSPSGPPPPPYDAWRKSIALSDASPTLGPRRQSSPAYSTRYSSSRYASTHQANPFAKYEDSYFKASSQNDASTVRVAGEDVGMPSPPQSPTDGGWSPSSAEHYYQHSERKRAAAPVPAPSAAPTAAASTLPTPPQSFTASMQSQAQQYQPHAHYARHNQYELPAPMPSHRRNTHTEDIATTVLTLPTHSLAHDPVTPMSPLTLSNAFGRRSTLPAPLHYQHNYQQQHHHHQQSQQHLSPRMAAKMTARKDRVASFSSYAAAPSTPSPARKSSSLPKPHCNVKYETAELDFIMYERTTKNRPWEDVTASFNAALPHLRQYAEMDYMRIGGGAASPSAVSPSSADMSSKATMDRYRARPERTTPGLQASYYRLRLALPLLDEAGKLVFDAATNKQVFTEVMVRDDKSRKKNRRLSTVPASPSPSSSSSHPKPGEDSSVHLVLYFPERVSYYDYWFVSAEDKALARQRAYDRNMQRAQRGLPAWHPGCDDPESGILLRNKD
ncbi:hypothetical protein F503_05347 [Ophiostoma piceae UAMH 11346]|uniref:Uncharacterized protein n=1 Tax=Ophiostoma piceae (strain UAMH 11346) TaxID=1262450 RepID=S3CBJ5_OPHP1|nr:hypothetical protein F503_05347 [Ophiostoma piceae UAMH 11346]